MEHRFTKHYTREEARALLPELRTWLNRLRQFRARVDSCGKRLSNVIEGGGDAGGPTVEEHVRALADFAEVMNEFTRREIQIKDLDIGLVDFPALMDGKEVFLCWEQDEEDIGFWHDLDTGYAGRERL